MPDVRIVIGGREFEVACQPGEEHFLRSAADMLDTEASGLVSNMGRMPENRMLLMAGLMLADKAASLEDQLRAAQARAEAVETRLASRTGPAEADGGEALAALATLAAELEKLAEKAEAD